MEPLLGVKDVIEAGAEMRMRPAVVGDDAVVESLIPNIGETGEPEFPSREGDEFLFDLARDERERANFGKREPKRLASLRSRCLAWEESLPKHPDASYSVPATKADLARPS